ncbi:MAG: disulfide bond formation protein B [Gammaproteobacteria bacterium]|nr:disulfide bond formation protein B [Gammaproteobacteria bacterium]
MLKPISKRRLANLLGFLICTGLMAYAYYSQFHDGLEPCVLCIFQRIAVIILGLLFFVAFLHHPGKIGARIYSILLLLTAATGSAVSIRHIYIQHLPAYMLPPCGPGLNYMFKSLPLNKFIIRAFTGTADCSIIKWHFLGMTLPEWVLIWFVLLGVGGFLVNWRSDSLRTAIQ